MTSATAEPVRVTARVDTPLSPWLWLVKWLLALPHLIVLAFLWLAFVVLTVVAFFAILFTGRYPRAIFEFNLGVLRWSWRVAYYAYGALATDRYPPFSLGAEPDYPATLDIAYPEQQLSRGLVLVKWWLLAIPHYMVLAFITGGGSYGFYRAGSTADTSASDTWASGGGLIALLTLFVGIALLFTGRYPGGLFDLLLGLHRWVFRVAAYSALMTDRYPPFRLDQGGSEPAPPQQPGQAGGAQSAGAGAFAVPVGAAGVATAGAPAPGGGQAPAAHWSAGRVVAVVAGSVLLLGALGLGGAGAALAVADQAGRDADGYLNTPTRSFVSSGYALVIDPVDLQDGDGRGPDLGAILGDVRVRAAGAGQRSVFVGIGPSDAVDSYLAGVERERLVELRPGGRAVQQRLPGGPPATPPGGQDFWVASVSGPGQQVLTWTATTGRWTAVVMNTEGGRPVAAELSAGLTAPALRWLWIGLLIGAAVALAGGVLLVALAVRGRPAAAGVAPPAGPGGSDAATPPAGQPAVAPAGEDAPAAGGAVPDGPPQDGSRSGGTT